MRPAQISLDAQSQELPRVPEPLVSESVKLFQPFLTIWPTMLQQPLPISYSPVIAELFVLSPTIPSTKSSFKGFYGPSLKQLHSTLSLALPDPHLPTEQLFTSF